MSRRTELERGAAEQQTATAQRGNDNKKDAVKNAAEQRSLGTLAYNIRCKWKNQAKTAELSLGGEQQYDFM